MALKQSLFIILAKVVNLSFYSNFFVNKFNYALSKSWKHENPIARLLQGLKIISKKKVRV